MRDLCQILDQNFFLVVLVKIGKRLDHFVVDWDILLFALPFLIVDTDVREQNRCQRLGQKLSFGGGLLGDLVKLHENRVKLLKLVFCKVKMQIVVSFLSYQWLQSE